MWKSAKLEHTFQAGYDLVLTTCNYDEDVTYQAANCCYTALRIALTHL